MPGSSSPYSDHNFVLYLENSDGLLKPFGGFEEASDLPRNLPGRHKVSLALRRGVCDTESLWDWVLAQRRLWGVRWRNAIMTQNKAAGTSVKSWRLVSAIPKIYVGTIPERIGGDVACKELILSVEYIEIRLTP